MVRGGEDAHKGPHFLSTSTRVPTTGRVMVRGGEDAHKGPRFLSTSTRVPTRESEVSSGSI